MLVLGYIKLVSHWLLHRPHHKALVHPLPRRYRQVTVGSSARREFQIHSVKRHDALFYRGGKPNVSSRCTVRENVPRITAVACLSTESAVISRTQLRKLSCGRERRKANTSVSFVSPLVLVARCQGAVIDRRLWSSIGGPIVRSEIRTIDD